MVKSNFDDVLHYLNIKFSVVIMARYLLKIAYDGSGYYGWQKQWISPTVQEIIEGLLSKIARETIFITGSGRTDSGVHALAQYAHFDFQVNMTPEQIRLALNSKLPSDIMIDQVLLVPDEFHARFDAYERSYIYRICKVRTPFNRLYYSSFPRKKINTELILPCLKYFEGVHDFTSFSKPNPDVPNRVCDIKSISWEEFEDSYVFKITADRFLHNMVRRIVGCLINISHKKLNPAIVKELIEQQDSNQRFIPTAPSNGLYLSEVKYPLG